VRVSPRDHGIRTLAVEPDYQRSLTGDQAMDGDVLLAVQVTRATA